MAHLHLSRIITITEASGGTERVGGMGKCFIKDVSYQWPEIWRTFFIPDNVLTNIYVGESVREILSLLE